MRYLALGVALTVLSAGATAQDSVWGYFQDGDGSGAGVQAADGSQFLIKCDKTGKHQVFAVVVAMRNLAAPLPANKYESQPVIVRMDSDPPYNDNWRANDKFAMAVDQGNTRSLTRLLEKLDGASKMQIELRPIRSTPTTIDFNVAGAHQAIEQVYQTCKDDNPLVKG